jgi:N-acetylneuraminic acid mutarotase
VAEDPDGKNKIFVFGRRNRGTADRLASVEVLDDPDTNSWRTLTPQPTGRHGTAFSTLDGKIYVAGGATGTQAATYQDVSEVFSFG